MKKNVICVLISVSLLLLLLSSACTGNKKDSNVEPTATTEPTEVPVTPTAEPISESKPEDKAESEAKYEAYKEVLMGLYNNHTLPGIKQLEVQTDMNKISDNTFTVTDIDGDGRKELLVYYTAASMAGEIAVIYDYSEQLGECYIQLCEWPNLDFYKNGTIEAGWSHNQGRAGEFWPYTLYVYDSSTDTYTSTAYVDAYDKAYYESNEDIKDDYPFPYDADIDGNGFVYFYGAEMQDYQTGVPKDDEEYLAWLSQYTGGTEKLEIPLYNLTPENIEEEINSAAEEAVH